MSGIIERSVTARARLSCDAHECDERWTSSDYRSDHHLSAEVACAPAFDQGWRVFVGGRSQHTYCPAHGPKADMRLVHGGTLASTLADALGRGGDDQ